METITREQLRERLSGDEPVALVEVLGPDAFRQFHIPGAINVPVGPDFRDEIRQAVPDRDSFVVVYCSDSGCGASPRAAREMERLGYAHVHHYPGGKADWCEARLPIES